LPSSPRYAAWNVGPPAAAAVPVSKYTLVNGTLDAPPRFALVSPVPVSVISFRVASIEAMLSVPVLTNGLFASGRTNMRRVGVAPAMLRNDVTCSFVVLTRSTLFACSITIVPVESGRLANSAEPSPGSVRTMYARCPPFSKNARTAWPR
jgi:hypothetical protein